MELLGLLIIAVALVLPIVALIFAARAHTKATDTERELKRRMVRLEEALQDLEEARPPAETPTTATPPRDALVDTGLVTKDATEPVREEAPTTPAPKPPPARPTDAGISWVHEASRPRAPAPARADEAEVARQVRETKAAEGDEPRPSLEARIGGRWFNWIGIVALLLGVAFLIKYAHEQGWISPHFQLYGGIVAGLLMVAAGHLVARRGYEIPARGFWGGGIGILYLVLFAGYRVYGILDAGVAFGGMVATTVLGAALAILHDAKSVIVLAAIGGYLTPVLLGSDEPNQVFLFTYLSILTAGLLFVGYWRGWRFLGPVSLLAVLAYFGTWFLGYGPGSPVLTVIYMSVFLVLFTVENTAWSIRRRQVGDAWTRFMLVLVSGLHGVAGILLLGEHAPGSLGVFLLGTSAWHGLQAFLIHRFHAEDAATARLLGGAAALLLLLFPVFDRGITGQDISVVWALEALLLLATARWGGGWSRAWTLVAILLAGTRLALYDTPRSLLEMDPYVPLATVRGLVFGIVIGAFVVVSWFFARRERMARSEAVGDGPNPAEDADGAAAWAELEHLATTVAWILAVGLPLLFLSLELNDAFARYVRPAFAGREELYTKSESHWMTMLWAVYTALVLGVARRRGSVLFVRVGLVMGAAVLWMLGAVDLGHLYLPAVTPFLNARFAVLAVTAACLFGVAREFRRPGPERTTIPEIAHVTSVLGHVTALTAVSLEWFDFFHARELSEAMGGAEITGLSALAALYGLGLVTIYIAPRRGNAVLVGTGVAFLASGVLAYALLPTFVLHEVTPRSFLSFRFLAGAVVAAAAFLAARAVLRGGAKSERRAARLDGWLLALGHATAVTALSMEAWDLFARQADVWTASSAVSVIGGSGFALTAVWAAYGAPLLVYGIRRSRLLARELAQLLLGASLLGVVGISLAPGTGRSLHLFLDTRFLLGGLAAVALFVGAEAYRSPGEALTNPRQIGGRREDLALRPPLVLLGHALALLLLTLEARDATALRGEEGIGWIDTAHATQLAYSAIWALYAIGMVVAGFVRDFRPVRLMALVILLGTILKVFLFDLSFLENPYRIISFILLGLILVGVSFLYTRYKDYLVGEADEEAADQGDEGAGKAQVERDVEDPGGVD